MRKILMTDYLSIENTIKCCPRCKYIFNLSPIPAYFDTGLLQSFLDNLNKTIDKNLREESLKPIEKNNE